MERQRLSSSWVSRNLEYRERNLFSEDTARILSADMTGWFVHTFIFIYLVI